jgi:small subunit ribosomal protein S16
MLIIRLQRVGRTNDPSFRVIVTDSKNSAKTGKFLEIVGNYDARQGKPQFKAERIQQWIKDGAQVSETVHNLLVKAKIIAGKTIDTVPVKSVKTVTEAPAEAPIKIEEKSEETVTSTEAEGIAPKEAEEMIVAEEATAPEIPAEEVTETPVEAEAPIETKLAE